MKRGSTMFLRATIILIGLVVLALCVIALPAGLMSDNTGYYRPVLLGLYVPSIPFFVALYQAVILLNLIDKNNAFSERSVAALKRIKFCAIIISALFFVGMPYIFQVADKDDAPGVVLIGLVIIGASSVIATFAAVLQKLLQSGTELKSENDLTV
jgi:hypothetical protein